MYESMHGFAEHTNCADIQAEAQREYGLTPDDVHDSFNLFMATRVVDGMPEILRQSTSRGTTSSCSRSSTSSRSPTSAATTSWGTSNFSLNPVQVTDPRPRRATRSPPCRRRCARTPRSGRPPSSGQPAIRTERGRAGTRPTEPAFARDPGPPGAGVEVELDETGTPFVSKALHDRDRYADEGDALRDVLLSWWVRVPWLSPPPLTPATDRL